MEVGLVATIILVLINRGEQVYLQLLSAVGVGTIGFLITFVATLKPSTQEMSVATSVVEDMRNHLPVFTTPDAEASPQSVRASDLSAIALGIFAKPPNDKAAAPPPKIPEAEVSKFYLELLQYLVVRDLRDHQRTGWSVVQTVTPAGGVSRPRVNKRPSLASHDGLKGDEALRTLAANRFSAAQFERLSWEHMPLLLPQGARLAIHYDSGGEGKSPESVAVTVSRPNFFTLTITVTPIGPGTPGFLPQGLTVRAEDRPYCRTYNYVVDAKAHFSRLTAGSPRTEENKAWVQWVLSDLEMRFKD